MAKVGLMQAKWRKGAVRKKSKMQGPPVRDKMCTIYDGAIMETSLYFTGNMMNGSFIGQFKEQRKMNHSSCLLPRLVIFFPFSSI
jgi:hypothetical protein